MKLNDRDRDIYLKFIKECRGYKDEQLYFYSSIIINFINRNYNSVDGLLYDLDDFIQEAYALLLSKQNEIDDIDTSLEKLYSNMNEFGNRENLREKHNNEVSIKIDLKDYLNNLETKEQKILKAVLVDEDFDEITDELNISKEEIRKILVKILKQLKIELKNNNIKYLYVEKDNNIKNR